MKIIEQENIIYLDNDDQLIIKKKNNPSTLIECQDGIFTIDYISEKEIQNFIFHQTPNQIQRLKKFVKQKKESVQIRTLYHNPQKIILNEDETIFIPE